MQIGREAAAEVRQQYPIINDDSIDDYLDRLGDRLVEAAPRELNNPAFQYSFTPVNLKDINAFALPGGPMFVNRGMIEAATTEGQVAGVMAHELAHVLLRHGTANATKQQGFQIGALAGAIAGAVIGGNLGQIVSQGSQFGLGTWAMKYSREYEKQADLIGAQIMARAGYDPRDLAGMFETIAKQGGGSPPQWLSSHPNPGNRTQYINAEAKMLRIGPRPSAQGFQQVRSRLSSMPPARTMAELERSGGAGNAAAVPHQWWIGRPHWRGRASAVAPVSNGSRRSVVPGQCADQLAGGVVGDLGEVRPAECLRRSPGTEHPDPRRGAWCGARVVARSQSGDAVVDRAVSCRATAGCASPRASRRFGCRAATPSSPRSKGARSSVALSASTSTRRMLANGDLFYVVTVVPERELRSLPVRHSTACVQSVRLERTIETERAPGFIPGALGLYGAR